MFVCKEHVIRGMEFYFFPHIQHVDGDEACAFCSDNASFFLYYYSSSKKRELGTMKSFYMLKEHFREEKVE